MIRIHKEGIKPLLLIILILGIINIPVLLYVENFRLTLVIQALSLLFLIINFLFFRKPVRTMLDDDYVAVAPADGQVMVVEETEEPEFFQDRRIQVSIFMSVWNVHINWYPVSGEIIYQQHHPGKYLVARLPKSSEENERSTMVIRTKDGTEVLVRQIAGAVARRIITYGKAEEAVKQGEEMGFIRYGSRVDLFLPPDKEIFVRPGDHVAGGMTHIARTK